MSESIIAFANDIFPEKAERWMKNKVKTFIRVLMIWEYNRIVGVVFWPSTQPNLSFQSDAPEGSDTFQWQLWEEIT